LTTLLHYEAEDYGVKVSALCPAFVNTPILQKGEALNMDKKKIGEQLQKQKTMSPDKFAAIALQGLERNEPVICPMPLRKTMDIVFTLVPSLHGKLIRMVCRIARKAKIGV